MKSPLWMSASYVGTPLLLASELSDYTLLLLDCYFNGGFLKGILIASLFQQIHIEKHLEYLPVATV